TRAPTRSPPASAPAGAAHGAGLARTIPAISSPTYPCSFPATATRCRTCGCRPAARGAGRAPRPARAAAAATRPAPAAAAATRSPRLQDARHGAHHAIEVPALARQLPAPGRGEVVVPRPPVPGGRAPFARDPALEQHALQRGVERTLLDPQHLVGKALDRARNFKPVQGRAPLQHAQNQQHQAAGGNLIGSHAPSFGSSPLADIDRLCRAGTVSKE